jgi:hypothetical protein
MSTRVVISLPSEDILEGQARRHRVLAITCVAYPLL